MRTGRFEGFRFTALLELSIWLGSPEKWWISPLDEICLCRYTHGAVVWAAVHRQRLIACKPEYMPNPACPRCGRVKNGWQHIAAPTA